MANKVIKLDKNWEDLDYIKKQFLSNKLSAQAEKLLHHRKIIRYPDHYSPPHRAVAQNSLTN